MESEYTNKYIPLSPSLITHHPSLVTVQLVMSPLPLFTLHSSRVTHHAVSRVERSLITHPSSLVTVQLVMSRLSQFTSHLTTNDLRFTINHLRFTLHALIFLVLLTASSFLHAEEGEIQLNLGGGAFFPLSLKTDDRTVIVYSGWNVGLNTYFGLSDNFDIGIQPSFTRLADTSRNSEFEGLKGREYFNYWRFQCLALLRYNIYPGSFFSLHIIAGGGFKVETFTDWEFYNSGNEIISAYKKGDYAKVTGVVAVGIDLQFRVWEWFILSTTVLYKWSPGDHSIDLFGFLGATFFVNYYR